MGSVLTEERYSLWNFFVCLFIVFWFVAWTWAAKNMIKRTDLQRREMINDAAREINRIKADAAAAKTTEPKKDK